MGTNAGRYLFHDLDPDVPHSKGAGSKVSPERQKQIDALESGEYSGKNTKGTEKTSLPKPKSVEPRGEPIEFIPAFKQEVLALKTYEKLRATGLDMKEIETFARNTGLSVKEAEQLKTHLILTKHVNLPDHMYGKYYYEGYFDPNIDIAHGWERALKGELSPEEKKWFRELTDHELDESKRMQNNEVYRTIESWDPVEGMTGNPPGAHDNAPKPPGIYPGFNPKF
ncbi:hypothetical protein [Paenibacillus sp. NRS-1781]|uniref:hypothetical protein n=1 Tax=Paenibacillus sp. NRS-1781 TaxID=3233905 RepID=UPI003D2B8532